MSAGGYSRLVKEKVLVVGLGEVGRSLFELLKESEKFEVYGWDVDGEKMQDVQQGDLPKEVDVLHICYLCRNQETFVETTADYVSARAKLWNVGMDRYMAKKPFWNVLLFSLVRFMPEVFAGYLCARLKSKSQFYS